MAEHGEEIGPRLARARFPASDKATWSRWCKQVREENAALEAQQTPAAPRAPLRAGAEPLRGVVVPGVIDFYGQIGAMLAACGALQDYAWPCDPVSGQCKVRKPMMLERATRLRNGARSCA
jgi:hypothetical protein